MTDDVKELTQSQKRKSLKMREFGKYLAQSAGQLIAATFIVTVFSIFIAGDFDAAFTVAGAVSTTGHFLSNFALLSLLLAGIYFYSEDGKFVRNYTLCVITLVITFIACAVCVRYVNLFALPIALVTLVVVELLNKRIATLSTAILAVMIVLSALFTKDVTVGVIVSISVAAVSSALSAVVINFFVDKHFSRLRFLLVSIGVALFSVPYVVFFTVASGDLSLNILWNSLWSYGASVGAALVFMPLIAVFEGVFNIADDFRLNELCNLGNPLLKRLAGEAPGTFNHSLVVGILAEACASAIDENPNLARCAAYYHDIGKLKAPLYFSENQSDYNPHDELIPEVSVSMITSHTLFGEILAKQNRLPPEIVAICREHHGTAPVGYFYRKALTLKEEGDLAVDKFTYAGPKPQSKTAAIIMIADTIEAALRAYMPETREEYENRVNQLVDEKIVLKQFDECPITMGDIAKIKQTIIEVLPGVYHGRVPYDTKRAFQK